MLVFSIVLMLCWNSIATGNGVQVSSVNNYGAIANDSIVETAVKNSISISNALPNASQGGTVLIPKYSKATLSCLCRPLGYIKHVYKLNQGSLIATTMWPVSSNEFANVINFTFQVYFILTGPGTIDGQGYTNAGWSCSLTLYLTSDHTSPRLL